MNKNDFIVHGGEYDNYNNIKLDFSVNINPLGMPGDVCYALTTHVRQLEKYPDRNCTALKKAIVSSHGSFFPNITADNIFIGNGASEVISLLANAISPKRALIVEPTFSGYERALTGFGCKVEHYMLQRNNSFKLEESFLSYLTNENIDVLFICSPNNPTGQVIPSDLLHKIADICEDSGTYLVVDQCFMGFVADKSTNKSEYIEMINDHPHMIIIDAFTKIYAMPGIRLGYCISSALYLLNKMLELQPEWSISTYAQIAGCIALEQEDYLQKTINIITSERAYLTNELSVLGFTVYPSDANFILFNVPSDSKARIMLRERLAKEYSILIRSCDNFRGLNFGDYRIAVKCHDDNITLINALKNLNM